MLTTKPTRKMIAEWKKIFKNHRADMHPNRKSGTEVDAYFRERYKYNLLNNAEFCETVAAEIAEDNFLRAKLQKGMPPNIKCYSVEDVTVGIDINSGFFHIESEDFAKSSLIYDDLFAFRGLDETDLNNFFLVAEYVKLTEKSHLNQKQP